MELTILCGWMFMKTFVYDPVFEISKVLSSFLLLLQQLLLLLLLLLISRFGRSFRLKDEMIPKSFVCTWSVYQRAKDHSKLKRWPRYGGRGNLFSWRGRNLFFKKKWAIPGLFLYIFVFSIQLVIYKLTNECSIKFCRWLESNRGPLTALPTEPQPLPGGRNHLMDKTLMSKTKAIVINGI